LQRRAASSAGKSGIVASCAVFPVVHSTGEPSERLNSTKIRGFSGNGEESPQLSNPVKILASKIQLILSFEMNSTLRHL
jgi:hypothetical protein